MNIAVIEKTVKPVFGLDPELYRQFMNWREQLFSALTRPTINDDNLCMNGKIRTKQKCPKCQGNFKEGVLNNQIDLWCPDCFTHPTRYYIVVYWKKLHKIYSDQNGQPLNSFERASRLLSEIRRKIDKKTFDAKDYIFSSLKPLQFTNCIKSWVKRQENRLGEGDIAPSYYEKIESITRKYFIPFFEDKDVREIRTSHIDDFRHSLPINLKLKTRKNILDLLRKFFNDLYDREDIKKVPKFPEIKVPEPHWNWVDVEEQEMIYNYIPDKHKPIFAFMKEHGCRPGEARALWREDINFKEGTAIIRRNFSIDIYREMTKTKDQRLIPIQDEILSMLKQVSVLRGFIFVDPDTGDPYKKRKLQTIFVNARKKAGIEDLTLYQWSKHSFCSQAINRGVPHKLVNEMVGTKTESASRRYQHANVAGLKLTLKPKAKIYVQDKKS